MLAPDPITIANLAVLIEFGVNNNFCLIPVSTNGPQTFNYSWPEKTD